MSELMRKIVYYENILEFKENTKSELNLTEVNNWQLCRTCLIETGADDVDMEKMCVMDALKGRFLNVQEMLVNTTGVEFSSGLELPSKLCKECLDKITSLYFFTIQVRNAEKVLTRLAIKLDGLTQQNDPSSTVANEEIILNNAAEECFIYEEDQYDAKHLVIEVEINDDTEVQDAVQCLSDNDQTYDDDENLVCLEVSVNAKNPDQNDYIFSEEHHTKNTQNIDFNTEEEHYLVGNSQDTSEVGNEENSKSAFIEDEAVLITAEQFEDNSTTNDSQQLHISEIDYPTETVTKQHFKHKQPRVRTRLLDDMKCAVCDQIFQRQRCLVEHVQKFHPSSKAFKCRDCGMLFFSYAISFPSHEYP